MFEKPILRLDYGFTPQDKMELRITVDKSDISEILSYEKPLVVKIEKVKKRRSLDSNAYLWVLADEIAKVIRSTKEDVYKKAIQEVGVFKDLPISDMAVMDWITKWEAAGLGWFSDTVRESKLEGYTIVRSYYGTSVYNSQEMSRIVDYLVDEAQGLGIDTRTPNEIEEMKQKWGKEN
jgi:hypothetical protein